MSIFANLHPQFFLSTPKSFISNFEARTLFTFLISIIFSLANSVSSTYSSRKMFSLSSSTLMYKQGLNSHLSKPIEVIKVSSLLYHCYGDYLSRYKDLFNKHIKSYFSLCKYPLGFFINIFSSNSQCKKIVFTSICSKCIS